MITDLTKNLYFETTHSAFTRAQALIWVANGLSILNVFEKSTGKLLSEIIRSSPENKSILVNFIGIDRLDDHSLDDVYEIIEHTDKLLIIFNGQKLLEDFTKLRKDKEIDISFDSANKCIIIGKSDVINFSSLFQERRDAIDSNINSILKRTFTKFPNSPEFQRLCSTPFLANGEFDSKKIIENPKDFMWISFYLSDKLQEVIETEKLSNIKLISASLRGAPFASILGILNDIDYVTVDHIGPKHKVYNSNILHLEPKAFNYIYIGDFVFGGTEIKITKTYVTLQNSSLNYALVLGSLFGTDVFTDFSLFHLKTLQGINSDAIIKLF